MMASAAVRSTIANRSALSVMPRACAGSSASLRRMLFQFAAGLLCQKKAVWVCADVLVARTDEALRVERERARFGRAELGRHAGRVYQRAR